MRFFNTAGPCVPAWHYVVDPLSRLVDARRLTSLHVPLGVGTTGLMVWYDLADERMCHCAVVESNCLLII